MPLHAFFKVAHSTGVFNAKKLKLQNTKLFLVAVFTIDSNPLILKLINRPNPITSVKFVLI